MAQLPKCSGVGPRYIYSVADNLGSGAGSIEMYDPKQPGVSGNPFKNTIDDGSSSGLAISTNINGPGPSPTFYGYNPNTSTFQYWDGSKWVNTNHSIGSPFSLNLGAGGGLIYSFDAINGLVYKYNGTSDATLVLTIPNFKGDGPYDIVADCDGNFYILKMTIPRWFRQYNSNGALLRTWTLNGGPTGSLGGGMVIIDNDLYFDFGSLYKGTFNHSNNTIDISVSTSSNPLLNGDFASCPLVPIGKPSRTLTPNPAYYCGYGTPTTVQLQGGSGPATWTLLSGTPTLFGSGDSIGVTAQNDAKIVCEYYDTTLCGISGYDTLDIIIPRATVDAGPPKTIEGCGIYVDSLQGSLTNPTTGISFNAVWEPSNLVTIPGTNKMTPIVRPTTTTNFVVTVTSNQGNCVWKDSVLVTVEDLREDSADFTFDIDYGCTEDIVKFKNTTTTTRGPMSYIWSFGDSSPDDTVRNPVHTYTTQDTFGVTLIVHNGHCYDTISKDIPLYHPLDAAFEVYNSVFCTNLPVEFDARQSVVTQNPAPKYTWNFGDGQTGTGLQPKHTYKVPGKYKVLLTVTDFVPCSDTVSITLDNFIQPPYVEVGPPDTILCAGEKLNLPLGISVRGTSYKWSTGDTTAKLVVEDAGKFYVQLSNGCGSIADTIDVTLKDCSSWLPNAFTPNGDNLNDVYRFRTKYPEEVSEFSMSIFNRKGNLVFKTEDLFDGWDGTYNGEPQPIGSYYYMIKYKYEGVDQFKKGDITLVR